ncbi:MAG: hypothetical protein A2583_05010 [Bdellovibrionales bacterium RIFOXYD1_FULL_53_11]|nr:MAG: hypothetical protein A2583_05010 [Bdellovibrionales bacterium RIFOXYD1_FULL_53_11]
MTVNKNAAEPGWLIVYSSNKEDEVFAQGLASAGNFLVQKAVSASEARRLSSLSEKCLLLWEADNEYTSEATADALPGFIDSNKVIAITSDPINRYPYLFKRQPFAHHVLRKFGDPFSDVFARIVLRIFSGDTFGLAGYFPEGTPLQRIALKRSSHKAAVVDASCNYLVKSGLAERVAGIAAQAIDELVMNAVFDAPVNEAGVRIHKDRDRAEDFALEDRSSVEVEAAINDRYCGITVTDQWGSLKKEEVLNLMRPDYKKTSYVARKDTRGAGLGLSGASQGGMSLVFAVQGGEWTQVTLLFPRSKTTRAFREGFKFTCFLTG